MANGISITRRKKTDGTTVWGLRVRRKGQYHSETFLTKSAASAAGNRIANQMDQGSFTPSSKVSSQITLGEALDRFIEELPKETERQRTYRSDRLSHARQIKRFAFSRLPLNKVEKSHIREFRDKRSEECKPNTVNNNINTISKVYSHAISEWDIVTDNPTRGIVRPKKSQPRARRLSEGEEELILDEACRLDQHPWFAPLVQFLIYTGMRLGEVANISPNDVDIDRRTVFLSKTKTNFPRHVPLPEAAKQVLVDFAPLWGHSRIFHVTSNTASSTWLAFKSKLLENRLIKSDLHLHDLRHEGVSRLFEMKNDRGEPLLTVAHIQLITGHKDINTLVNVYANITADSVVDAMKAGGY